MNTHGSRSIRFALASACALVLAMAAACGREEAPKKVSAPAPDPAAEAAAAAAAATRKEAIAYYDAKCSDCHGSRGAGNGLRSDKLVPAPRNFQDPAWQREVKDAWIEDIIVKGGPALGKSKDMPEHADLKERPEIVTALRSYIRSFGR